MQKLTPPVKRYLLGSRPSHSTLARLADNFKDIPPGLINAALEQSGYLENGRATRAAAKAGIVDACEKTLLWNLQAVEQLLRDGGLSPERRAVNQEVTPEDPDLGPQWVNLGTLGTHFGVTANAVGKWLEELGLKEGVEPTPEAIDGGYTQSVQMNAGGKKTRTVHQWNLGLTRERLMDAGHELNFDYEATLKGRGRNGDVQVQGGNPLEERAREFAREFTKLFANPATRSQAKRLVEKTPRPIQNRAEVLMRRPGLFTRREYMRM